MEDNAAFWSWLQNRQNRVEEAEQPRLYIESPNLRRPQTTDTEPTRGYVEIQLG